MSEFRSKKRVVFTTWGSFGDLHPHMALALEMQARGYHSVIATSPFYREKLEAAGIPFHPVRPDLPSPDDKATAEIIRRLSEGAVVQDISFAKCSSRTCARPTPIRLLL